MDMLSSRAEWQGALARRYLIQLCKHFQHGRPVTLEEGEAGAASGSIAFDAGTCTLRAEGQTLTMIASAAGAGDLARVQDVVGRHFERFAFREDVALVWQPEPGSQTR
jgi:uncharacterized protein